MRAAPWRPAAARGYDRVYAGLGSYQEISARSGFSIRTACVEDDRNFVEIRAPIIAQKDGVLQRSFTAFGGQSIEILTSTSGKLNCAPPPQPQCGC
jgi:hypothetical protein